MAGWSDLSTALKRNVIGRLDLMSRYSFRCSDRQNRSIVDTTDHFIPRARLSIKESGYLIMIHSGIDDWLRVEIRKVNGKTVIKKYQSSWKSEDVVETVVPFSMRHNAVQIMLSLLGHNTILIDAMEIEVEGGNDAESEDIEQSIYNCSMKMVKLVSAFRQFAQRNYLFRVRKLVTDWHSYPQLEMLIREMLVQDELKCYERLSLAVSPESLTPLCCLDTAHPIELLGKPQCTTTIHHSLSMPLDVGLKLSLLMLTSISLGHATLRFAKVSEREKDIWLSVDSAIEQVTPILYRKKELVKTPDAGIFLLTHLRTPCGYWIHAVTKKNEHHLKAHLDHYYAEHKKTAICGLGWLCKRCTNAFDHDYYQNLGRRVHHEPEWADVHVYSPKTDREREYEEKVVKAARQKYSDDVQKTLKIPKTSKKKAWGFGINAEDSEVVVVEGSQVDDPNYLIWEKLTMAIKESKI